VEVEVVEGKGEVGVLEEEEGGETLEVGEIIGLGEEAKEVIRNTVDYFCIYFDIFAITIIHCNLIVIALFNILISCLMKGEEEVAMEAEEEVI
jgi:hypothetical protein